MDENDCSLLVNPAPFYKQHSVGNTVEAIFHLFTDVTTEGQVISSLFFVQQIW